MSECCDPAPPVVAFDQAGNVVYSWGGPSLHPDWPDSNHGIIVDQKGIVWIGGNGGPDSHILKFTREGKFVGMFGKKGARMVDGKPVANSNDMDAFGRVAKIFIDPKANEAYVADGYFNKRVAVVDMDSGKIKRYWGAYGNKPDDAPLPPLRSEGAAGAAVPHAGALREMSNDGMVYVCDRPNDRIQVFTKEGKFVKEKQFFPETLSDGSVWDIAFSRDPQQRFLYMADGANEHVYIIDRNSLEVVSQFGEGGRQPGQFRGVHSIAVDSKGNIYTTETYTGKRLQKFVFKGMGAPQSRACRGRRRSRAVGQVGQVGRVGQVGLVGSKAAGRAEAAVGPFLLLLASASLLPLSDLPHPPDLPTCPTCPTCPFGSMSS